LAKHELVESIMMNGVLVPVTVRPVKDGNYEMISGHRRLYAVKEIGLERIPAIVKEYDDDEGSIRCLLKCVSVVLQFASFSVIL
jgi:ParB/RepB/Spo0J family partition protein